MKIRNVSGRARQPVDERLPALVDRDEVIDVDDEALAASLLAQPANWVEVAPPKSKAAKADDEEKS
jgi:hypothetical protein